MDGESSKRIKLESILHDQRLNLNLYSPSLKDLREITNDFSDKLLIGQGAFGRVYKGLLQNGDIIAVKKLISTMPGLEDKQYENEARHLMRLVHTNIVQLVGYCSETEKELVLHNGKYVYAEKSERLLCLEYLPKGSLRDHISDASSGLDWYTRYKIIAGICCGLHYLHEEWKPNTPIVHRDLKPANILLDDNMVPKIADFGLSRLFGEEQTRTITKNFNGTLGYMAPEYLNRGIITKELDIFSLGVVIIQVVTGDKHYPYKDETSQEFIELVLKKWRNRLGKVPGYTSQEFDCRQIRRCIEIGLLCVKYDRAERPTTRQIIEMLSSEDAECRTESSREIPEEVAKALTSFLSRAPSLCRTLVDQNRPPRYKLTFTNGLGTEVFTKKTICDTNGDPLKITIIANNQEELDPRFLSAKIRVVVLDGDFDKHNQECWTLEEFSNSIVRPRDKVGAVLTGDLELSLTNGEAYLHGATFIDKSKFVRSGKFRLGVMVIDNLDERVQEGITEPFTVKERQGEGYKKHDIPLMNDDVWRLKKISKDGAFHDALRSSGILSVKDFLKMYYKDEQALRKILIKATELAWTTIVEHAKKCDPGRELYSFLIEGNSVLLFFNSVCQIVGAEFGDDYSPFDDLEKTKKDLVTQWSKVAYKNMTYHQPDYEMDDDFKPRPISQGMFQGIKMLENKLTDVIMQGHTGEDTRNVCQVDNQQGTSGCHSKQCMLKRLGSIRFMQNDDDESFDFNVYLDSELRANTSANDIPLTENDAAVPQLCEDQQPEGANFSTSLCAVRALADYPMYSRHGSFKEPGCHDTAELGAKPAV